MKINGGIRKLGRSLRGMSVSWYGGGQEERERDLEKC